MLTEGVVSDRSRRESGATAPVGGIFITVLAGPPQLPISPSAHKLGLTLLVSR